MMKVEELKKLTNYNLFLLKAIMSCPQEFTTKDVRLHSSILIKKYPEFLIRSKVLFYKHMEELQRLGFIKLMTYSSLKVWEKNEQLMGLSVGFVAGYFVLLEFGGKT